MAISADAFKEALSRWASGVSVVTTNEGGRLYGITVSSFSSLSLDPPLILICLGTGNRLSQMIIESRRFAVSILSSTQQGISNAFAGRGRVPTEDITELGAVWGPDQLPIIEGALASMSCSLHTTLEEGDHLLVVGRVESSSVSEDTDPLLYYHRSYRSLSPGS
ncbi:MAG TPA: flavin reductase [Deltaproteobacteria bacterium]|nr:flavin reductase [Deltaproteobacteria bacterium]